MRHVFLLLLTSSFLFSSNIDFKSDKQKHFGASALFGTATGFYMQYNYKENSYTKNIAIGTAIAIIPGVLKELYDTQEPNNNFDGADIAYDFLGSLVGNIVGSYISKSLFIDVKKQTISYNIRF